MLCKILHFQSCQKLLRNVSEYLRIGNNCVENFAAKVSLVFLCALCSGLSYSIFNAIAAQASASARAWWWFSSMYPQASETVCS